MTIKELKELVFINNNDLITIIHSISNDYYIKRYRKHEDFVYDEEIDELIVDTKVPCICISKEYIHIWIK